MIKIKNLHLENYRGFSDTTINFDEHITCIAGINGAGKSSILYAIAKAMCLMANKASLTNKKDYMLKKDDIHRENSLYSEFVGEAKIKALFDINGDAVNTENAISFFGGKPSSSSKSDKAMIIENTDFPVLSLYSVGRYIENMEVSINKEAPVSDIFFMYSKILSSVSDYEDFFIWFKNREDIENERILSAQRSGIQDYKYDLQLESVRHVISSFFGKNYKARVSRVDNTIIVENRNSEISFSNLSDGEKSLFLLLGDIARKLAVASSIRLADLPTTIDDILKTSGIILIDEIELHLHPSWQRKISKFLTDTFPNCQFIITTHSPQVLGELQPQDIRLLNNFQISIPSQSYGLDSNSILDNLQNTTNEPLRQNTRVSKKIDEISNLIDKQDFKMARKELHKLEIELNGSTADTVSLGTEIALMEGSE